MTPLLSVNNVHVSFKTRKKSIHAVRGVSFDLFENEILGIVGESGCGKSAMAKALIKLLPKYSSDISGEIFYQNHNLLHYEEKIMQSIRGKEIGMIFQDPLSSLNPTMKIGNQIIEGYDRHHKRLSPHDAKTYAIQLLELVGIPHAPTCIEEYPHTLSGGMRQRVMIALALAPKPKLIIADEPTTALDVTIQAQILDLMHQIKDKMGTSFILITHDLSIVASHCDQVLVMYAGEVVEKASVSQLFEHPSHPYTKGLLQSMPRLDMDKKQPLIPIEGAPPNLTESIQGCSFCPRCKEVLPICNQEKPKLIDQNKGHSIACWRIHRN